MIKIHYELPDKPDDPVPKVGKAQQCGKSV